MYRAQGFLDALWHGQFPGKLPYYYAALGLFVLALVAFRVIHSVWQATVNRIPVRGGLFLVSSLILIALAVRALMATLAAAPGAIA